MATQKDEILRVIDDVLAPLVRADQGELYLVETTEDRVGLHLAGRFNGCPGNTLVARRVLEPAIHAVAPSVQVTVTSGFPIPPNAVRVGGAPEPDSARPDAVSPTSADKG